jgi:hypothetical protein
VFTDLMRMGSEIADGLAWLHDHGVALGSLHSEAVLYSPAGGCMVSCMNRTPQFCNKVCRPSTACQSHLI